MENELVKPGLYEATILYVERKKTKKGAPMTTFEWMIEEGDHRGEELYSNFVHNNPDVKKVFERMVRSLGEDPRKVTLEKPEKLINRKCRIRVGMKDYNGEKFNTIERYFPSSDLYRFAY